jgi:phosphoenolpyruvate-protein kinase (PTS system EI component)
MRSPRRTSPIKSSVFQHALVLTRHQIQEVQHKVSQALNAHEASIFDAHLLVLDDPTLIDSVTGLDPFQENQCRSRFSGIRPEIYGDS